MSPPPIDLTGQTFGYLTVERLVSKNPPRWACRCKCGKAHEARSQTLKKNFMPSCGCRRVEKAQALFLKHGHARKGQKHTPEYMAWANMLSRVRGASSESNNRNYHDRGISVCARWKSFENFLADMGPKPPGRPREWSIDRIDNAGNYEPSNCRWATQAQQSANKRTCWPPHRRERSAARKAIQLLRKGAA